MAFDFPFSEGSMKNTIFMKRPYLESFLGTKKRIGTKLERLQAKARKITADFPDGQNIKAFCDSGLPIPNQDQAWNFDIFFGPTPCATIDMAGVSFEVSRNAVWLDKVELATEPLVGCPIMPSTDWKKESGQTQFHWFTSETHRPIQIEYVADASSECPIRMEGWHFVGTGPFYRPTEADLDNFLAVVVDLGENGMSNGAVSGCKVKMAAEGERLIFEQRQIRYCRKQLKGDEFRLVSYNVLAHLYLKDWLTKKSQVDQYFPYCPIEYQFDKYRYPLLLREIPGYNADLLFLQEVDFRLQIRFLTPFLQLNGYVPVFNCKENQVNEGLVIAFRADRFDHTVCKNFTVKLSNLLGQPSNADIAKYLSRNPDISTILSTRPTILQLLYLRAKQGTHFLCANTHLHFDPAHEEVKILQSLLCARYIAQILEKLAPTPIQVLFAGDFNCEPGSRAIRMLQGQQISLRNFTANHQELDDSFICRVRQFIHRQLSSRAETVTEVKGPMPFQCASGFPEYTNYTRVTKGFVGCLDYIWAYPPLHSNAIPMPEHELVTKYGALPSKIAPSDHLPLICDVSLMPSQT